MIRITTSLGEAEYAEPKAADAIRMRATNVASRIRIIAPSVYQLTTGTPADDEALRFEAADSVTSPSPPCVRFQALAGDLPCSFGQIKGLQVHDRKHWGYGRDADVRHARMGGW